ncbi:hypothetical protein CRV15_35815 (plasmid) [Streptomyces clavuligerus]|nr:hypothetical protein CRV15_35815 [Streptomyces clavuligerus]
MGTEQPAPLLARHVGNADMLMDWIARVRAAADLPHLHAFTQGQDMDDSLSAGSYRVNLSPTLGAAS